MTSLYGTHPTDSCMFAFLFIDHILFVRAFSPLLQIVSVRLMYTLQHLVLLLLVLTHGTRNMCDSGSCTGLYTGMEDALR